MQKGILLNKMQIYGYVYTYVHMYDFFNHF